MDNYTGMEYLKIDIAGQYGLDKKSFEFRINWVDQNEVNLEKLNDADDCYRYIAAIGAYRETQAGKPTGHICGMDACASGIQMMSIMMGCKIGARNTGLIGQERMDIYAIGTDKMNELLDSAISWPRDIVKPATMTFYYGSKEKPREAFGDDTPELRAFYKAQKYIAPGAYKLMSTLLHTWQPFVEEHAWTMPDGFKVRNKVTQMTDTKIEVDELDHATFLYRHEIIAGSEEGLANAANVTHSVDGFVNREMSGRCQHDPEWLSKLEIIINKELGRREIAPWKRIYMPIMEELWVKHEFMSIAGAEHVNKGSVVDFGTEYLIELVELVEYTVASESFELISVHDEFKAHANNMNAVRKMYIEICAELAESNILNAILAELTGKPSNIEKMSTNLGDLIRQGNYALS